MGKTRQILGNVVASSIQILAGPIDLPIAIGVGIKNGIDNGFSGRMVSGREAAMQAEADMAWLPSMKLKKVIAGE